MQANTDNDTGKPTHFVVAHDFWKFLVLLIPMILVTFISVAIVQVVSKRLHNHDLKRGDHPGERRGNLHTWLRSLRRGRWRRCERRESDEIGAP